jgi:hypothetical protein
MTRRPKWLYERFGPLPKYLEEASHGRGISVDFWDHCFWLDDPSVERWVRALEAVDKRGDKGPLLSLLRSECDLPREARIYLADLLDRHQLKKSSVARRRVPLTTGPMHILPGIRRRPDEQFSNSLATFASAVPWRAPASRRYRPTALLQQRCNACGTPCAGIFEGMRGKWGRRRQPVIVPRLCHWYLSRVGAVRWGIFSPGA